MRSRGISRWVATPMWMAGCLAGGETPVVRAADDPPYPCYRAESAIRLDGKADEPAWRSAREIGEFKLPWEKPPRSATTSTRAKLLWDDRYLYYFAEMQDGNVKATREQRDGELWLDDVFELFFKPRQDDPGYYEFQVNPLGTLLDIFYPERAPGGYADRKNRDRFGHAAQVVVTGTLNDGGDRDAGWSVEGRIPWTDFNPTGGGPGEGDAWRFTLCRYDYDPRFENKAANELSVSADSMIRDFHAHEHYAVLSFEGAYDPRTALPESLQAVGGLVLPFEGTPEPPPPYRAEPAFGDWTIPRLIDFQFEPGTGALLYVDQPPGIKGSRLVRLKQRTPAETEVLLEWPEETLYSLAFHPDYESNGQFFVSHFGPMTAAREERRMRVQRLVMKRDGSGELVSEPGETIIEWETWGHTGGAMAFDDEGKFYVTTGDGTGDSDTRLAGQDLSHLLAKVLRLDVDQASGDRAYSIPPDNPFLDQSGVRPETFAYGLRNPWRMAWDSELERLWVGNNGQDRWEQVYLVEAGANYGWSVYEGSEIFYAERERGPHPIQLPTLEHDHGEARSLTGGLVYRGDGLPELKGAYVYGDHSTGKIWGARHDGEQVTWAEELADTTLAIVQFNTDPETGDLLVGHHAQQRDGGGIYRLVPFEPDPEAAPFPRKLGETGLFTDVASHRVRPEILGYDVIVPQWADGAEFDRFVALPASEPRLRFAARRGWGLPDESVVFQTVSQAGRRLETRMLVKQAKDWKAYTYAWNAEQTEAELVGPEGVEIALEGGGTWKVPSRVDCMNCHSRAANFLLGLEAAQLNRDRDYGHGFVANQLQVMDDLGWFLSSSTGTRRSTMREEPGAIDRLVDPFDETNPDIERRARSFLHARCSGCHRESGGGNAMMHLQHFSEPEKFGVIDGEPLHGNQGLEGDEVRIVKPGDPLNSVMLQRVSKSGPGQMPPVGSQHPDPKAVGLLLQWIMKALPPESDEPE